MMAETSIQKHQLATKLDTLAVVEKIIDDLKEAYQIPDEIYGNILVSISEATNNAIKHGNKLNPEKVIDFNFTPSENSFTFSISDQGSGFDPSNVPDPTHPDNIDKPYGRGIFIMKNLADEVEFLNDGKVVKLIFNR